MLLGVVQRGGGIQHIHDGTCTYGIAGFHRIQRALGRDNRLFVRVNATDGSINVVERRTHGLHHAAVRAFQLFARANKVVLRLFHLRVNHSALIQPQREAQTNFVLAHVAVVVLITRRATVGF